MDTRTTSTMDGVASDQAAENICVIVNEPLPPTNSDHAEHSDEQTALGPEKSEPVTQEIESGHTAQNPVDVEMTAEKSVASPETSSTDSPDALHFATNVADVTVAHVTEESVNNSAEMTAVEIPVSKAEDGVSPDSSSVQSISVQTEDAEQPADAPAQDAENPDAKLSESEAQNEEVTGRNEEMTETHNEEMTEAHNEEVTETRNEVTDTQNEEVTETQNEEVTDTQNEEVTETQNVVVTTHNEEVTENSPDDLSSDKRGERFYAGRQPGETLPEVANADVEADVVQDVEMEVMASVAQNTTETSDNTSAAECENSDSTTHFEVAVSGAAPTSESCSDPNPSVNLSQLDAVSTNEPFPEISSNTNSECELTSSNTNADCEFRVENSDLTGHSTVAESESSGDAAQANARNPNETSSNPGEQQGAGTNETNAEIKPSNSIGDSVQTSSEANGDIRLVETVSEACVKTTNLTAYRVADDSDNNDSSDSSSSDSSSSSSDESDAEEGKEGEGKKKKLRHVVSQQVSAMDADSDNEAEDLSVKPGPVKTRGELSLHDLPPLDELKITLPEDVTLEKIGTVASIIDLLVVIQGLRGVPALDTDTYVFVDGKVLIGQIFETFGPVPAPLYSVRFNKAEDISRLGVAPGRDVFCVPLSEQLTRYVFTEQLRRLKGSDASWEHNNEPPSKFLDFSDDEEERRARAKARHRDSGPTGVESGDQATDDAFKRRRGGRQQRPGGDYQPWHQQQHFRPRAPGFEPIAHWPPQPRGRFRNPQQRHHSRSRGHNYSHQGGARGHPLGRGHVDFNSPRFGWGGGGSLDPTFSGGPFGPDSVGCFQGARGPFAGRFRHGYPHSPWGRAGHSGFPPPQMGGWPPSRPQFGERPQWGQGQFMHPQPRLPPPR